MAQLPELGIDLEVITQQLEDEGVEKFNQPFDKLMGDVGAKVATARNKRWKGAKT